MFQEIDTYIDRATEQGYSAFLTLGARVLAFLTNVVLTGAVKGQTTLAEHLSRSGYGGALQDETDAADEAATAENESSNGDGGAGDTPRRRRRGRGRVSESADADESANEILRAAYQREVASAGEKWQSRESQLVSGLMGGPGWTERF